jgi:hypothetical protein
VCHLLGDSVLFADSSLIKAVEDDANMEKQ